jgi:hypothetical protein
MNTQSQNIYAQLILHALSETQEEISKEKFSDTPITTTLRFLPQEKRFFELVGEKLGISMQAAMSIALRGVASVARADPESKTRSAFDRVLELLEWHAINPAQAAFLLREFGYTTASFADRREFLVLLTPDVLRFFEKVFGVNISWIMGSFAYPADHGYRYRDVSKNEKFEARVNELLAGKEHVFIKIFKSESHNLRDTLFPEKLKIYIEHAIPVGGNDTKYVHEDWTPQLSSMMFHRLKFALDSTTGELTSVVLSVPDNEFKSLMDGSFHVAQLDRTRRNEPLKMESIFAYTDLLSASVE